MSETLHYQIEKLDDSAPWLMLIHGLFGSLDNLALVKRHLASKFNVISVDLPNHGLSPRLPEFTIPKAAQLVANTIASLGLPPVSLVGHSLGGKVGMSLALSHPELVDKLVVADIAPVAYQHNHKNVMAGLDAVDLTQVTNRGSAEIGLSQHVEDAGTKQFLLKSLYQENGQWHWRFDVDNIKANYHHIIDWPTHNASNTGKTLFIKGELSDYIVTEHAEQIRHYFPNAEYKMIQGTGHWLHAQKPVIFNRLIEKFLG